MTDHAVDSAREETLVLAVTSVNGATAACAEHGDRPSLATLLRYYAVVAAAVERADGRVVKVMGDGMLVVFPVARAGEAIATLRGAQAEANRVWASLDARCRVVVKVGAGRVLSGDFGPPGAERYDVHGDALNRIFKAPSGEFTVLPEVEALLA